MDAWCDDDNDAIHWLSGVMILIYAYCDGGILWCIFHGYYDDVVVVMDAWCDDDNDMIHSSGCEDGAVV